MIVRQRNFCIENKIIEINRLHHYIKENKFVLEKMENKFVSENIGKKVNPGKSHRLDVKTLIKK